MDFIGNLYLDEIRATIRARKVPWEGYVRAEEFTAEMAAYFKNLEKQPVEQWPQTVKAAAQEYAAATFALIDPPTRDDAVRHILLLVGDLIPEVPEFTSALLANSRCWEAFAGLLANRDEQIALLASRVIAELAEREIAPLEILNKLLQFLASNYIASPNTNLQEIAVQELALLLQTNQYRPVVWEHASELIPRVLEIAQSSQAGLQVQYSGLLVLWLSSFDKTIAKRLVVEYPAIGPLLETAKVSIKEKIVRVAVATLANLARLAGTTAVPAMIAQRGLPILAALSDRKWADDELRADIDYLKTTLDDAYAKMTTFDQYEAELQTKRLLWSPPHKSVAFWKGNIDAFKAHDWKVLKQVVALLTVDDPVTKAVACNDIASVIETAPEAVPVLDKAGAKIPIMELMNSSDSEVRYEALKATQALIGHMFA